MTDNIHPFDPKKTRKPKRPPTPPGGWPSWHHLLHKDDKGRITPDLANVLTALRSEQRMREAASYNEMLHHSIVEKEWPCAPGGRLVAPTPHETNDDDIARLQEWLQSLGVRKISRDIVGQAVETFARERAFHPVREQLKGCAWDGKPRLSKWLFTYLGAKAETDLEIEYVTLIGRMFLIAMVARVMQPGCQCDYMLVLEGEQGILKSTACRILAGDYFSDSLPDNISSKDAKQHIRRMWLVEISELAAFSKAAVEPLKAFISRREEQFRPPYGKHEVTEPRQCVFVGTTNQDVYIKDGTGGRRFWPIVCLVIDIAALAQDRDQLLAEAYSAFLAGERYWPTQAEEDKYFKAQQEKRQEDDPWDVVIREGLQRRRPERVTALWVAQEILDFESNERFGRADQNRITSVLKTLGWTQKRSAEGRWYYPPRQNDAHDANDDW